MDCNNVSTIPQLGPTCWFNALLVGFFYSQGMRNVMFSVCHEWKSDEKLVNILYQTVMDILLNKYVSKKVGDPIKHIYPEHILKIMHMVDNIKYSYDPAVHVGNTPNSYIVQMFKLLHIAHDTIFFDFNYADDIILAKNSRTIGFKHISAAIPKVVIFQFRDRIEEYKNAKIKIDYSRVENLEDYSNGRDYFDTKKGIITFNKHEYIIDSLYISNFNSAQCSLSHAIAGVTCNSERYVYNGWTTDTVDPGFKNKNTVNSGNPCKLMKYDWIGDPNTYCIDTANCKLTSMFGTENEKKNLCFNFKKGGQRIYFAVRRDIFESKNKNKCSKMYNKNESLYNIINFKEKCPPKSIRHPVTLDCIQCNNTTPKKHFKLHTTKNLCLHESTNTYHYPFLVQKSLPLVKPKTTAPKVPKVPNVPKVVNKECPPGKIINPKSGRCIIDRTKVPTVPKVPKVKVVNKECPPGKIINPKSGRCIIDRTKVPTVPKVPKVKVVNKECPPGKIINPKSGRCIIDKSYGVNKKI